MAKLGYRPGLDGLRGLSVLAVITYHSWIQILPGGKFGVDVFFVLSGFLITTLLLDELEVRKQVSFKGFYARRALRLLPALALTIPFGLLMAFFFDPTVFQTTRTEAISSVFYITNLVASFNADHGIHNGLLNHTWSLSIEEQFYLAWPLILCSILRLRGLRWAFYFAVGTIALVVFHRLSVFSLGHLSFGTDTRADTLLVGCVLALGVAMGIFRSGKVSRYLGLLAGVALLVFAWIYNPVADDLRMQQGGFTVIAILTACVLLGALSGYRILAFGPLVYIGRISYGLYLYHFPIEQVFQTHFGWGPVCWLLTMAGTFLVASLSYRYVEKPFLRLKKHTYWPSSAKNLRLKEG